MVNRSSRWIEDCSSVHGVSFCWDRPSGDCSIQPEVEQDRVFLPLGYEPGYDYPLLVWLPESTDTSFDLGRTMMRMSLRNYLAVLPAVPSDSESCFQAIDTMVDRYSVHHRRVCLIVTKERTQQIH